MPQITDVQKSMLSSTIIQCIDLLNSYLTYTLHDPSPSVRVAEIIQCAYNSDDYSVPPLVSWRDGVAGNFRRTKHILWGIFHANFAVLREQNIVNNPRDTVIVSEYDFPETQIKEHAINTLRRLLIHQYTDLQPHIDISELRETLPIVSTRA